MLLWLPIAIPLYWVIEDSNASSIATLAILYTEFILLVRFWGRRVYRQPGLLWRYGLDFSQRTGLELLAGLIIGVVSLLALFSVQGLLGLILWQSPSIAFWHIVLEGLLVALSVGFAEELFFRGWLLDELQRDYHPQFALWANAAIFALVHGIKPQCLALLLLGVTLVLTKRSRGDEDVLHPSWASARQRNLPAEVFRRGRLGLPIGLHAGLVWGYYIVNVGKLINYAPQAPEWLTGFDRNPLAGVMGILFLSTLAIGMGCYGRRRRVTRVQQ